MWRGVGGDQRGGKQGGASIRWGYEDPFHILSDGEERVSGDGYGPREGLDAKERPRPRSWSHIPGSAITHPMTLGTSYSPHQDDGR